MLTQVSLPAIVVHAQAVLHALCVNQARKVTKQSGLSLLLDMRCGRRGNETTLLAPTVTKMSSVDLSSCVSHSQWSTGEQVDSNDVKRCDADDGIVDNAGDGEEVVLRVDEGQGNGVH